MRIAQVSPLIESVPPRRYGGTERVVSWLTEELVRMGHDVVLFASADSRTSAELVPCAPRALRCEVRGTPDPTAWHTAMAERVAYRASEFDLIHYHCDLVHFPIARRISTPSLTTLHGRLDLPGLDVFFDEYADQPLVSISGAQREPLPRARWVGTVHHGLPSATHQLGSGQGGYFAFLGRISPEKGVEAAIAIATSLGVPLKIAAKLDERDRAYFERDVRALFEHPLVEMIGEIGETEKSAFLGDARALLFPIDWPEPFGLVMIEAMACGTPVIAFRRGSVPEIVEDGVTGFVVEDVEGAIGAASRAGALSRARIRREAERRFSARAMAESYLDLYSRLVLNARERAA
jgi:glycosyltransferase involved in cell wall biosynthesis